MIKFEKEKYNLQYEKEEQTASKKLKCSHTDLECGTQGNKRVPVSKFMAEDLWNSHSEEEEKEMLIEKRCCACL